MGVITAKYAGTCGGCREDIAVGDQINYGGRGRTHCMGCGPSTKATKVPRRKRERAMPAFRGRCEDAPCCGCC